MRFARRYGPEKARKTSVIFQISQKTSVFCLFSRFGIDFPKSGIYFYSQYQTLFSNMARRSLAVVARKLEAKLRRKKAKEAKKKAREALRKKVETLRRQLYGS